MTDNEYAGITPSRDTPLPGSALWRDEREGINPNQPTNDDQPTDEILDAHHVAAVRDAIAQLGTDLGRLDAELQRGRHIDITLTWIDVLASIEMLLTNAASRDQEGADKLADLWTTFRYFAQPSEWLG